MTKRRSSGMDQHDTIHEEDENVSGSESSGDDSSCNSASSGSSSSRSGISDADGGDGDGDSNSVASAPSQLGDSDTPRPKHPQPLHHRHNHYHSHHLRNQSIRGCDCHRTQGRKCSVRLKYHRFGGLTIIYPEESLYTALRLLAHCKLHRLPVFDDPVCGSGNPLFVLTHRSLLAYLYKKQIDLPRPKYLQVRWNHLLQDLFSSALLINCNNWTCLRRVLRLSAQHKLRVLWSIRLRRSWRTAWLLSVN